MAARWRTSTAPRDLNLKRTFAVKVIDNSQSPPAEREQIMDRTRAEIEAMARLRNPHVVKIYDVVDIREGVYALIMDHVRGRTLDYLLKKRGRIKLTSALQALKQIAQGVYEAHQVGMIHRDLKPANIMVESLPAGGLFARVLDFGVVHMTDTDVELGQFVGTPLYCAPEQIQSQPLDPRADIYSLGALFYHMLTGNPPFDAVNYALLLVHHMKTPVPSLTKYLNAQGPLVIALDTMIERMMSKNPNDRYSTMFEVIQAADSISHILAQQGVR